MNSETSFKRFLWWIKLLGEFFASEKFESNMPMKNCFVENSGKEEKHWCYK